MIQELLSGVMEDRKTSTIPTSSPSQSATSSPSSASAEPQQNLRCPRCDSSNTKFCYYNNYNLTQPRHFCKTCRRYWTKGGALRNVPIGGGCRKTKSSSPSITIAGKTTAGLSKAKPMTSSFDVVGRAPPELLWAGMPHSSHLMALLRASQMQNSSPSPNPNPNPGFLNPVRVKEEGGLIGGGAMMTEPQLPMFRNESPYQYQQQQQNMLLSEVPTSSGIQELYQRLRSSSSSMMNNDHLQVIANNASSPGVNANYCLSSAIAAPVTAVSVMSTASSIMEPIPLTGGEFGYWNPMMTWPDISTANGAFP